MNIIYLTRIRYPFLASEIFDSDIAPITNSFFVSQRASIYEPRNQTTAKKKQNNDDYEVILSNNEHDSTNKEESKTETEAQKTEESENKEPIEFPEGAGMRDSLREKSSLKSNIKRKSTESISLLDHLFLFLNTDEILNPVLCGYFNKLVQVLFKKNSSKVKSQKIEIIEQLIDYIFENPIYLEKMVQHISERSISELIPLFLSYENIHYEEKRPEYLLKKLEIVERVIQSISSVQDSEVT